MAGRKTAEEIAVEIDALRRVKPKVRAINAFGEDNHETIDAQLSVLRERMSMNEIYDTWGDEDAEEFAQHLLDAAIAAFDWMTGMGTDVPSEGWV